MCPYNQPYIAGSVICSTKPHSKLLASVRVIVVLVSPRVMRILKFCLDLLEYMRPHSIALTY